MNIVKQIYWYISQISDETIGPLVPSYIGTFLQQ